MTQIAAELLFWVLAIFFFYGAVNNFLARGNLRETYRNWGYPAGFHYVTAVLELVAAIFFAIPSTRVLGSALASCIMIAAILTLWRAGYGNKQSRPQ